RNEEFLKLAHELCLQIVASNPQWLSREDIPEKIMREKQKQWEQELETAGKKG
ncbi:elongation factor Ts, partial [archaeon]|nr:elongation factor Ts [archaeon]